MKVISKYNLFESFPHSFRKRCVAVKAAAQTKDKLIMFVILTD